MLVTLSASLTGRAVNAVICHCTYLVTFLYEQ